MDVLAVADKYGLSRLVDKAAKNVALVARDAQDAQVAMTVINAISTHVTDNLRLKIIARRTADRNLDLLLEQPDFLDWLGARPEELKAFLQEVVDFRALEKVTFFRCAVCGRDLTAYVPQPEVATCCLSCGAVNNWLGPLYYWRENRRT